LKQPEIARPDDLDRGQGRKLAEKMAIQIDPRAKALIFDVDGTLVDTMPFHFRAWQEVGRIKGFEMSESLFFEFAGVPTRKLVPIINKRLGAELEPEETAKLKEELFIRNIHEAEPILPTVSIVRRYFGKLPMAAGTGATMDMAVRVLTATKLYSYVDVIVSADDVVNHKPAPDTFLECAEKMHVAPESCQVFKDGQMGITAARRANMIVTDIRPYV